MTALDEYREQVRQAILRRTGEPILNGNIDHARIIIEEAFACARSKIRLLSTSLDPSCYAHPNMVNAAKVFASDPDRRAEILVESSLWDVGNNFDWKRHPLIEALSQFKGLTLKRVPPSWTKRYSFNFLLLDDYGFRYEGDRLQAAAVAAFLPRDAKETKNGKPNQVENLGNIFSELSQASDFIISEGATAS